MGLNPADFQLVRPRLRGETGGLKVRAEKRGDFGQIVIAGGYREVEEVVDQGLGQLFVLFEDGEVGCRWGFLGG